MMWMDQMILDVIQHICLSNVFCMGIRTRAEIPKTKLHKKKVSSSFVLICGIYWSNNLLD